MTDWTRNDLERIGAADALQIASFKADGTLRKPVTIWVVRIGDDLILVIKRLSAQFLSDEYISISRSWQTNSIHQS
jgi:hypothetical protein